MITTTITPEQAKAVIGEPYEDFYRCQKCFRLCTLAEMVDALSPGGTGRACPCGSLKYGPAVATWRDYPLPQVIRFSRLQFGPDADTLLRHDLDTEMDAEEPALTDEAKALWRARLVQAQRETAA
jgi:hypothetical protein